MTIMISDSTTASPTFNTLGERSSLSVFINLTLCKHISQQSTMEWINALQLCCYLNMRSSVQIHVAIVVIYIFLTLLKYYFLNCRSLFSGLISILFIPVCSVPVVVHGMQQSLSVFWSCTQMYRCEDRNPGMRYTNAITERTKHKRSGALEMELFSRCRENVRC